MIMTRMYCIKTGEWLKCPLGAPKSHSANAHSSHENLKVKIHAFVASVKSKGTTLFTFWLSLDSSVYIPS